MFSKAAGFALVCGAFVVGCGADQAAESAGDTREIVDNLLQAGYPASEISVVDQVVYVGNDAAVSLQASREMLETDATNSEEQYRTNNLVSTSVRTICINASKFTGSFSTAVDDAIQNYNAVGLNFTMRRISNGGTAGCDAVITGRISGPTGGSSGFPSGGLPFNKFQIGSGLKSFAVSTIAHVITHELGHTIGFRHSDFFDRSISCGGSASNEGDGGIGAILIPGTPSGATVGGSIMNSCFRTVETGEFTNSDLTALNALY